MNADSVAREHRKLNSTRARLDIDLPSFGGGHNLERERQAAVLPPTVRDEDGVFVGIAISGGGSRSANFASACMFELQRIGILKRVDYISCVSGGSLTGALYCTSSDEEWNPGDVQRKLTQKFASMAFDRLLLPWNYINTMFSDVDRTDILASVFADKLLSNGDGSVRTFADLRPDRPKLLINSTNLQTGRRVIFCDEWFDQLNSDLEAYPLANACAASSAVPVLLHPLTLRDYSTSFKQYRHLIDGGVIDNLGISTLVDLYSAQIDRAIQSGTPSPYPRGAVFILFDAQSEFDSRISGLSDIGLLLAVQTGAQLSTGVLINRASDATMADLVIRNAPATQPAAELRDHVESLRRDGYVPIKDRFGQSVEVFHISPAQAAQLSSVPFKSFGERINNISTYFNIDPNDAYDMNIAASLVVAERFESRLRDTLKRIEAVPVK